MKTTTLDMSTGGAVFSNMFTMSVSQCLSLNLGRLVKEESHPSRGASS